MGKGKIIGALFLILIGVIIVIDILAPLEMVPHGYDGVTATTKEIEHDYDPVEEFNTGLWIGIDPYNPDVPWGEAPMQTGIRCSISSPQFVEEDDFEPISFDDIVTIDGAKWWETTTQRRALMSFEMTAIVQTYGNGFLAIEDIKFWIELQNNDYSVFTNPNDSAVAILNVYTAERPYIAQEGADIEFEPEHGGYDFPLYTIANGKANIPDTSDVNIENFKKLGHVKFPIHILSATPAQKSIIDLTRVECQVEFKIGIDVLLIGEWKQLRPYRETEGQDPDLTWWEQLLEDLGLAFDSVLFIFWIIFGLGATIISFWKVPDKRVALGITALVWIIVAWQLGYLDQFLAGFSG